jgi:hypothetical protein
MGAISAAGPVPLGSLGREHEDERDEHGSQMRDVRSRKDSASDVDHLEVLGTGKGGDVSWLGSDVEVYRSVEPGDLRGRGGIIRRVETGKRRRTRIADGGNVRQSGFLRGRW